MKSLPPVTRFTAALLALAMGGSIFAQMQADAARGTQATLEEVLYIPSSKSLKRMSLGYRGLLADIYWTRAVQYFGDKHIVQDVRYDLLYPLLDITTDLDPHLVIGYTYGSFFLSQAVPSGAGQPDKAVELLEKGIRYNPDEWRLYFNLGFVHFMDRKDLKSAYEAFDRGSRRPDAHPFLKVMAANVAQEANQSSIAAALWTQLYDSSQDKLIRENAAQHLTALRVDAEVQELEHRASSFRERNGRLPTDWYEMVRAGLLHGVPPDPTGKAYKLMPDGSVQVSDPDALPFISKGLPPGWKKKASPAGQNRSQP
jgi:tetratricopeptide (TPR) repeat protein